MNIQATDVRVEPFGSHLVDVYIEGAGDEAFLAEIDPKVAVEHYGTDTLLDLIGQDEAVAYFGLE